MQRKIGVVELTPQVQDWLMQALRQALTLPHKGTGLPVVGLPSALMPFTSLCVGWP